jgi:hypothetical protein
MVGWWTLDESGPAFYDRVLGNTGTASNTVSLPGGVGGFVRFNGVSSVISIPDVPAINFGTGDFSIDLWLRTGVNQPTVRTILDKRDARPIGYHLFTYRGRLGIQLADASGFSNFFSNFVVANGQWNHVAVTVERANHAGIRFYLNGVLGSATADPTARPGSLSNTSPLLLGAREPVLSAAFWRGDLDEVELFDRVLRPDEIAAIAAAGTTGKCKCASLKVAPRAWWRFDEPSSATALDSGGDPQGPFDGNIVGAVRNPTGKVGGDLVFGGTSYVEVPNAAPLALSFLPATTGAMSIDAWINTSAASGPIVTDVAVDPADRGADGYSFSYFNGQLDFAVQAIDSNFNLTFLHVGGAGPAVNTAPTWHLVGVTLSWGPGGSFATATLFVDGVPVATSGAAVALAGTAGGDFRIGSQAQTSRLPNATFFTGEIDEVEIFDRALTQADFLSIYAAGAAGKCQPCSVPPRGPTACGTRGAPACPGGEFCDFLESCGATDKGGLCAIRPQVCSPIAAPVCGCDQVTYANACEAAAQGSSVAHTGPC